MFQRKHIKAALKANEHEILQDEDLKKILKKFIDFRLAGSNIPSPISQIVECYELCDAIAKGSESFEDRRDDLLDMCFTEAWEDRFSAEDDDEESRKEFLRELMEECVRRMRDDSEYKKFKQELIRKLES